MGVHFQSKCWVKWKSARKLIEKSAQYELGFHHSPWETAVSICHGTETVLCVVFLIFFFVTAKRWKFSWWTADFCPLSACLMLQRLSCEQMISVSVWESESACVCESVRLLPPTPPPTPPLTHTYFKPCFMGFKSVVFSAMCPFCFSSHKTRRCCSGAACERLFPLLNLQERIHTDTLTRHHRDQIKLTRWFLRWQMDAGCLFTVFFFFFCIW